MTFTKIADDVTTRVMIVTVPDEALTGLVTGHACALYDEAKLSPERPPASNDLFKVVAWSRTNGIPKRIGEARCEPSGYWAFHELDQTARGADEYFVAVTANEFTPIDKLPAIGDGVTDMAWQWKKHAVRPLVRGAGQALRPPGPSDPTAPR